MKTVKETFRDAISEGDWNEICRVFTAMTGEAAPIPPTAQEPSLDTMLDQPMGDPLDTPMTVPVQPTDFPFPQSDKPALLGPSPTPEEDVWEDDGGAVAAEETLVAPISEAVVKQIIPEPIPPTPPAQPDDVAAPFYIEHGTPTQGATNEDGETACRKESMSIPEQRENRFRDNGKAFAHEKVNKNPDDPTLGIQSIRPRGLVRDKDLGVDTGAMVDVWCGLCKKREKVSARLASNFRDDPDNNPYRCNDCSTPSGRAKVMRKQREEALNGGGGRVRQG